MIPPIFYTQYQKNIYFKRKYSLYYTPSLVFFSFLRNMSISHAEVAQDIYRNASKLQTTYLKQIDKKGAV